MNTAHKKYLTCCLFVLLFSCTKEKTSWDLDIISPLAYSNLSITDLVNESYVSATDNEVLLRFQDTVYQANFTDLLTVPDTTYSFAYTFPFYLDVLPGNSFIQLKDSVQLNIPDAVFQRVDIRTGSLKYQIVSTLKESVDMVYQIPQAYLNGTPLRLEVNIPAAGTSPASVADELDLSGYSLYMSQSTSNSLSTLISAYNHSPNDTLFITLNDSVQLTISFEAMVPDFAQGYFGQSTYILEDPAVPINAFGNIINGALDIEKASLTLSLINSMGVDALLEFTEFKASNNGTSLELNQSTLNDPIKIPRAELTATTPLEVKATTTPIALDTATATAFLNLLPKQLSYHMSLEINPEGDVSGGQDFYAFGYGFAAAIEAEIPLRLGIDGLTIRDTVEISKNNDIFHQINNGTLRLIADNTFPLEAKVKLYLINMHGNIEDTLVLNQPIAPGESIQEKKAIPTRTIIEVPADAGRLDNLYNTQQICIEAILDTKGKERVALQTTNYLKLKLIAEVNTTVNK